jgi:hypothetical protein
MPAFDGTGPQGFGPQTGRGMGPCGRGAGFRPRFGRGFGRAFGFFRGRNYNEPAELSKSEQKKQLKEDLRAIEDEKKEIENEIKRLS